jgi:hypothetical protein
VVAFWRFQTCASDTNTIRKACIVADRGIISAETIAALEAEKDSIMTSAAQTETGIKLPPLRYPVKCR